MLVQKLQISPTKDTPAIVLDLDGFINIKGRWLNGNGADFIKPTLDWIDGYLHEPAEITYFDIHLEYFNGIYRSVLLSLIRKILTVRLKHKKLFINWFYEEGDEEMLIEGEYMSSVLNVPFTYIIAPDIY